VGDDGGDDRRLCGDPDRADLSAVLAEMTEPLYDVDILLWSEEQAELLIGQNAISTGVSRNLGHHVSTKKIKILVHTQILFRDYN
jgi:hypothetical protein